MPKSGPKLDLVAHKGKIGFKIKENKTAYKGKIASNKRPHIGPHIGPYGALWGPIIRTYIGPFLGPCIGLYFGSCFPFVGCPTFPLRAGLWCSCSALRFNPPPSIRCHQSVAESRSAAALCSARVMRLQPTKGK